MDGAIYATLSRNMAIGKGSFWDPYLSEIFFKSFHDHPPLVFGIESLFFSLFGDHFWTENVYSFVTLLATVFLLKAFWKKLIPEEPSAWWWPLLFFALTPTISWSFGNNMLENTMGFFAALSVFFLFKNRKSLKPGAIVFASISIVLGFYSKGPTSLFPLATPFFLWIVYRNFSFAKMILWNLLLLALSAGFFAIIYFGVEGAAYSWDFYINKQVFGTLSEDNPYYTNGRTFILQRLFMELIIPIGLSLIIRIYFKFRNVRLTNYSRHFWFFVCTGLSAILPIMVSPKQWSFYTVPSIIYMVLAMAVITYPYLKKVLQNWNVWVHKGILGLSIVLFSVALGLGIRDFGTLGRDMDKLESVAEIGAIVPEGSTVSADINLKLDWSLLAYFARYHSLSLDFENQDHQYFISKDLLEDDQESDFLLVVDEGYLKLYKQEENE